MKRKVEKLIKAVGGTIERTPNGDIELIPPTGYHWAEHDIHLLVHVSDYGMKRAWESAASDLDNGRNRIEECTPDSCQCWENDNCGFWGEVEIDAKEIILNVLNVLEDLSTPERLSHLAAAERTDRAQKAANCLQRLLGGPPRSPRGPRYEQQKKSEKDALDKILDDDLNWLGI